MTSAPPTNPTPPQKLAPLRSVYTAGVPELLTELGISLFVTTYQAGRLVILRANRDGGLNTHFRPFAKPMGLALNQNRLAIGAGMAVHTFQDVPAAAQNLEPAGAYDGCYLPRHTHHTGDILVHEMAWVAAPDEAQPGADGLVQPPELWLVNTRFSCLCTLHAEYSFVPRWQPPFVSSLTPEDRCHLNGLALVDGQPRYATALGTTDTPGGWRERKKDGGVLLDIPSGEIIVRGLAMPHSPRWYKGRLWILNSGAGELGIVEPASGAYQPVARLPGFTRGLDFFGRYAFIGLSQVRESAVFSGIPIAEMPLEKRACGIWIVDLVGGNIAGFVRFEDAVQEIFAVQAAPGLHFPDLIVDDHTILANSFVLPDAALRQVPDGWRK